MSGISRFDIYLIDLNPTKGSEISKIRPCIVISPDEMNDFLSTIIVAPYTSTIKEFYPFRLNSNLNNQLGQIAFDQIKCVDKSRLIKRIDKANKNLSKKIVEKLLEIFG